MLEIIASIQHNIWAHWMKYLFNISVQNDDGTYTIRKDRVERWKRQMNTPYENLTESEKSSDRDMARIVTLAIRGQNEKDY